MKKKVVIVVSIVCLIFLLGGTYIIITTEIATSKLDYLIVLHRVEILREQLLINISKGKSDLSLFFTPHATSIDAVVANVRSLDKVVKTCFDCHRSVRVFKWIKEENNENVLKKLNDLANEIEVYKASLSRFLTMRANRERTQAEYNAALQSTQRLVTEVSDMIHVTSPRLAEKTEASYEAVSRIKTILYVLVVVAPFFAAGLGFIFVQEITKPVKALLNATRRLKNGDLDHRIVDLKDEFGEVAASFNEMSDSLKHHMHEIQESEHRYRTLFESAGDAIFVVETEGKAPGKIVDANPAAAEMHGYTLDELLKLNLIKDLNTPDADEDAPGRIRRILSGERIHMESNHIKKDGTVFPVEISAGLLQYMDHNYALAVNRDISDRKKMENEILRSKLDWEDTFNTITDMITIHDMEYNIIRSNKAAEKMLGLPFLELTQAKCFRYYHGKGSPPEGCPSCECLGTREPASFEMFEPHLNMFLEIRAMPRFDKENRLIGLIHVIRDITERKRVEAAMQRAEQMKMVGEWAAGLAHEIKNSLAGIKGTVEVIGGELAIDDADKSIILQATDEIKRIELLLKSLLNFAKPPKPNPTVINMNEILDKTVAFALKGSSLTPGRSGAIKASKCFDGNLPLTLADPMLLQQAFLNLLFNAIEAMPDGGDLGLKTHYDEEQKTINIMISDTGKGIDKEILESIFKPFFTTKKKGTGLGLAITRRLIEQQGGNINVESASGKGTVFHISLLVNDVNKELTA